VEHVETQPVVHADRSLHETSSQSATPTGRPGCLTLVESARGMITVSPGPILRGGGEEVPSLFRPWRGWRTFAGRQ
jgi:hypothetical protein